MNIYIFRRLLVIQIFSLMSLSLIGQSKYLVDVSIPEYDATNSEHFLISTKADWIHINDSDKRFFYVKPNSNYGAADVRADGSADSKRFISLYNGNDTHPALLPIAEQANVSIQFNNAHYWVVDRMSSINHTATSDAFKILNNSSNIILNRFYLTNFFSGIGITGTDVSPYTHDNTIQNCRFDPMSAGGVDGDACGMILMGGPTWNTPGTIVNTKILNNEIVNCNDGIQTLKMPQFCGDGVYYVDYPGTIIDGNHIYITDELFTDGSGNPDPNGLWALAENAVDLKGGSSDPENPMILSNNYFWGYKRTDINGGGSGSWGSALGGHYHVQNVNILNNVIFNSNRGITFGDTFGTTPYSIEDATVSGNILYNNGFETNGGTEFAGLYYNSKNVTFEKNTIVSINKQARWLAFNNSEVNLKVSCNYIIDAYEATGVRTSSTILEKNSFFNTILERTNDGISYNSAADAVMEDLTFTTDNLTSKPREITLPGVIITEASPMDAGCIPTAIASEKNIQSSTEEILHQNYPNPFDASTTIAFFLNKPENTSLVIYDMNGSAVAELLNKWMPAGTHEIEYNNLKFDGGLYYYRLKTNSFTGTKSMIKIN